jgi:hypothetical protein
MRESNTHSFIVKTWLEEANEGSRRVTWRGQITHVPSGQRRYLNSLDEITTFIATYLESLGVRFGKFWRMKKWLSKMRFKPHA